MNILRFFDRLEDKTRGHLSRLPIFYAIIGGFCLVLFWRGAWSVADTLEKLGGWWAIVFNPTVSLLLSAFALLLTGLFVSFFIGDRIILSGLTHEKKIEEKTESEVRAEGTLLRDMYKKIEKIEQTIASLAERIK